MFKLISSYAKADFLVNDELKLFSKGKDAARAAANLQLIYAMSYKVAPYVKPSNEWKEREQERLDSGYHKKVLPELQKYCLPEHFVHVCKKSPSLIAYTANDYKGANDLQTQSSISGYLERFAPSVKAQEVEVLQEAHDTAFAFTDLMWAKTPDEIVECYTNFDPDTKGVSDSCMRYENFYDEGFDGDDEERGWITQVHPVYVYGDSDISIAHLKNLDGKVVARAAVFEKKKVYSRVYGSKETTNRLHQILKKKGYNKSSGYFSDAGLTESLYGAMLPAIKWDTKCRYYRDHYNYRHSDVYYVMPYIDEEDIVTLVKGETEKDDYFLLGDQSIKIAKEGKKYYLLGAQSADGITSYHDFSK